MEGFDVTGLTTDTLEQRLLELESVVARLRAEQLVVLREVDRRQVPLGDGCRTLAEWVAGRLDVTRETALRLTAACRLLDDSPLEEELSEGSSFDRVHETARLEAAGASEETLDRSRRFDLTGVRRLVAQHKRMSRVDEREAFEGRRVMVQPSLDRSHSRLWGDLPGLDAAVFEQYRLQPHHITRRAAGGTNHPNNLTTLCCRGCSLRRYHQTTRSEVTTSMLSTSCRGARDGLPHRPRLTGRRWPVAPRAQADATLGHREQMTVDLRKPALLQRAQAGPPSREASVKRSEGPPGVIRVPARVLRPPRRLPSPTALLLSGGKPT
jgi:hypothetical protein